ncbi:hypothetical protein PG984_014186 [Apiospora sp. TS-2023a]
MKIPLVWTDCGTVPNGLDADSRHISLAETIRCYSKVALWQMHSRGSLGTEEQQIREKLEACEMKMPENLFQAIEDVDLSSTLYLLQDQSLSGPQKTTAFIRASQNGWFMVVKALADRGARIEVKDEYNRTALSYASELGDINTVRILISNEADNSDLSDHMHNKRGPQHLAARQGHALIMADMARRWSSAFPDIFKEDCQNMTPLNWAITSGSSATVRAILQNIYWDRDGGFTKKPALHWAIREGKGDIVDVLLEFEHVDPNFSNDKTAGEPPLVWTVKLKNESIFEKILHSKRLDNADGTGVTGRSALWWAAALGLDSYVQKLIDSGKVYHPDAPDKEGNTPLSIAIQAGHLGVVRQILKAHPKTDISWRAIIIAAKNRFVPVVKELFPRQVRDKRMAEELLEYLDLKEVWHDIQDSDLWVEVTEEQKKETIEVIQQELKKLSEKDITFASGLQDISFSLL